MNRLVIAAVAVGVLVVSVPAQATPPSADPTWVTGRWAGYLVRTVGSFEQVRGSWVQPKIVCNRPGSSAAFWLGLGGATRESEALEQIGTSADCSDRALVSYSAWYQLFPAPPVELPVTIRAGDTIAAEVGVSGRTVTVTLRNVSTGASFSKELWMRSPETDTAEWIVEAPSACFTRCAQLPLADFARARFTGASTTLALHTGAITDPAWSRWRLEMSDRRRGRAAVPTSLSHTGSSFDVIRLQGRAPRARPSRGP